MGGRLSNVILDPTLALIRAQLGFRIQVRAECGNKILTMILFSQDTNIKEDPTSNDLIGLEEEEQHGTDVLKRLVLSDWMRYKRGEELTNRIITALPMSHAYFFKI